MSHAESGPTAAVLAPSADSVSRGRLGIGALAAGLLAGLAAWLGGEAVYERFQPPMRMVDMMGYPALRATDRDTMIARIQNTALAYGLLGGAVGLCLGVAGGVAGRARILATARAGLAGLLVGAALAALAAVPATFGFWTYFGEDPGGDEILVPLLVHAGAWSAVGLAGGLALAVGLGLGRGPLVRSVVGGMIGAVVAAVVFDVAGPVIFPLDKSGFPISESVLSRLSARLLVGVAVAGFAVLGLTGAAAVTAVPIPPRGAPDGPGTPG